MLENAMKIQKQLISGLVLAGTFAFSSQATNQDANASAELLNGIGINLCYAVSSARQYAGSQLDAESQNTVEQALSSLLLSEDKAVRTMAALLLGDNKQPIEVVATNREND